MAFKVVSYESPMQFVVTVYELGLDSLYRTRLSQRIFPSNQRRQRDRYVEGLLADYAVLGEVHLRTMDETDEWIDSPSERERRGL